jgi:hypothetical protein
MKKKYILSTDGGNGLSKHPYIFAKCLVCGYKTELYWIDNDAISEIQRHLEMAHKELEV